MKTVWLASYPKSGNTWFRILVANLRRDTPVDINDLPERYGIASARDRFDRTMLFPSGLLTHDECDRLRPRLYGAMAAADDADLPADQRDTQIGQVRFVKAHDAYTITDRGEPLLGGAQAAAGAILIVRDPRDVAPSLAHHNSQTIDQAIAFMASPRASFSGRTDRQHGQLRQRLPGWSGFHDSWLAQRDIPVHVLRYEDMKRDTAGSLAAALDFAGVPVTADEAARAVRFADFDELRRQEQAQGFNEASRAPSNGGFFRRGIAGGWRDELTAAQAARISTVHAAMMERLGYGGQERRRMAG